MHEIKRYEFNGHSIEPRIEGGEMLFSFDDVAALCEYETRTEAHRLFRKHRKEFTSEEVMTVVSTVVRGRAYKADFLTPLGLYHYAMLVKTAVGPRFRAWVVETFLRPYLSGARMVTPEMADALRAERDSWRTRALDGEAHLGALEMRFARLEGRFESLCAVEETRLSRDAAHVAESRNRPEVYAIGRDRKRRERIERRGFKEQLLFEGMEGPDAFEALRARCFAIVTAEHKRAVVDGRALRFMRHKFARLAKGAPHRQAVAAIDSLVTDGSIDVQGGLVSVAAQMTTAQRAIGG